MNELKKEEREGERKAGREGGRSYEVQVTGISSAITRCPKASKYPRSLGVSSNMPSKDLFKILLRLIIKLRIQSRRTLVIT